MSIEQETELQIAQRAARLMYLDYTTDDDAPTLRKRVRAAWLREFGANSGAIVPPWLGKVLNEGEPATETKLFSSAAAPAPGSWSNR